MDSDAVPLPAVEVRTGARERIVTTAYQLFARRGIRAVGVDELIARSGVAKATFYKHFHTKDELVLAYLERWYQIRTAAIDAAVARHGGAGRDALMAVFDVFDDWYRQGAVEVNSFLHVMIEKVLDHPSARPASPTSRRPASRSPPSPPLPGCATRTSSPGPCTSSSRAPWSLRPKATSARPRGPARWPTT